MYKRGGARPDPPIKKKVKIREIYKMVNQNGLKRKAHE